MPGNAKSRLFCRIDGTDYFDWTVYWTNPRYGFHPKDTGVVIEANILKSFEDLDSSLLDNTFVPQHGSEIHVVPGCPVGMADVRKNYVIKRRPDEGCCNVFSPLKDNCQWIENKDYAIIPSKKAIVVAGSWYSSSDSRIHQRVHEEFPDIVESDVQYYNKNLNLRYVEISEQWIMLLKGELKKPCISYKKLEFKTDNEVNLDILYLVYKAGMQKWSVENQNAFRLQLCALNEHNWRDYPGTVNMLLKEIINPDANYGICANELTSISLFPKACRELIKTEFCTQIPFKSEKDMQMAQRLVIHVIGLPEDSPFTTIQKLATEFDKLKINMNCFYRTFDNIVKFRPKKFENESKD